MNELVVHAPISMGDMEKMATVIAQSGLFGVKNPVQALALMLIAQSEGLHPATAARDYHVIQGRPTLKSDAMLARFQAAGGKVEWHDYTDACVSATFAHPAGGKVKIEWTMDRAKAAGLTGKEVWKQYPRAMLRARVISEGIRTVYPGVLSGMYTPEEVRDFTVEAESPPQWVAPMSFNPDAAGQVITGFTDVNKMRTWFATECQRHGWKPGDATYEAVKAACTVRAAQLKNLAQLEALEEEIPNE